MIVAIDGPAGSGKSTVARALAQRLGFRYLDTGAMYRCVALACVERWGTQGVLERMAAEGADEALGALAAGLSIRVGDEGPSGGQGSPGEEGSPGGRVAAGEEGSPGGRVAAGGRVLLDGRDVTEEIRTPEVSEVASAAAALPSVRAALVAMQRNLLATGDWVAEGRDVGTVVAPGAELKVFLTADPAERARRRAAELGADRQTVLAEQAMRDARDEGRDHSPLMAALEAVTLDTTRISVEEVVERIAKLAQSY